MGESTAECCSNDNEEQYKTDSPELGIDIDKAIMPFGWPPSGGLSEPIGHRIHLVPDGSNPQGANPHAKHRALGSDI